MAMQSSKLAVLLHLCMPHFGITLFSESISQGLMHVGCSLSAPTNLFKSVLACAHVQGGEEDYTMGNVDDLDPSEWQVPPQCIPIHANVTTYDWSALVAATQFDVIMMDPPWQLATANPTRGGRTFCC